MGTLRRTCATAPRRGPLSKLLWVDLSFIWQIMKVSKYSRPQCAQNAALTNTTTASDYQTLSGQVTGVEPDEGIDGNGGKDRSGKRHEKRQQPVTGNSGALCRIELSLFNLNHLI